MLLSLRLALHVLASKERADVLLRRIMSCASYTALLTFL